MLRIGHRGARGHAPENTLLSVDAAIARGADMVEVDVQRTADGQLVLMHDKRVDRTTNGTGYVSEMTLAELRRLDAGGGQRIPTVRELVEHASGRVGLMLEIITPDIGSQLSEEIRDSDFSGDVMYASFLHDELANVSGGARLVLFEGIPVSGAAIALDAKATHVGISIESLTASFVASLHESGLAVYVYTVNDPRDILLVKSFHVDGVISDYPERI